MSHGRLWHTTRFRNIGSYLHQLEKGPSTYFSITCNMLGQLMKLAVSKSPAGQAVSDMVSVKRVSKSALQYSNTPRLNHNRHRLPPCEFCKPCIPLVLNRTWTWNTLTHIVLHTQTLIQWGRSATGDVQTTNVARRNLGTPGYPSICGKPPRRTSGFLWFSAHSVHYWVVWDSLRGALNKRFLVFIVPSLFSIAKKLILLNTLNTESIKKQENNKIPCWC